MKIQTLALLGMVAGAAGHGLMVSPEPRDGVSSAGNNKGVGRGPCGAGSQATKGASKTTYTAGDTIQVNIQTDIAHGGTCRVLLTSEENTAEPTTDGNGLITGTTVTDLAGGAFACCQSNGVETVTMTIPDTATPCENCLIQWYWDGDSDYFNCADVTILAAPDACDGVDCSGQGTCDSSTGSAVCSCFEGYSGDDCSIVDQAAVDAAQESASMGCLVDPFECGNGECNSDTRECECYDGYIDPPACSIKLENGWYTFNLNVAVEESTMDLSTFQAAVGNMTNVLASNDWDNYDMEAPSSSSDDNSSSTTAIAVLSVLLAGTVFGGAYYAYRKKQQPQSRFGAPKSAGASWKTPKQNEMI